MELAEKIVSVPQKENAGENSDDAFAFQKNWVFHTIIKLQQLEGDYVFVFEFHDDVLHLDSESPNKIRFIQIKKSESKNWTLNRLLKSGNGSSNSIIGKLYLHCCDFTNENIELCFVSDMRFSFSTKRKINAISDLKPEERRQVETAISKEIPNLAQVDLNKLTFERTELSFENHKNQLIGEIETFLETILGKLAPTRAISFYEVLQRKGERSRHPSGTISSFEELVKYKGLTKREITDFIAEIKKNLSSMVTWDDIVPFISDFSKDKLEILKYKGAYARIENRRKVNPDNVIMEYSNIIIPFLHNVSDESIVKGLVNSIDCTTGETNSNIVSTFTLYERRVLILILLSEYMMTSNEAKS